MKPTLITFLPQADKLYLGRLGSWVATPLESNRVLRSIFNIQNLIKIRKITCFKLWAGSAQKGLRITFIYIQFI